MSVTAFTHARHRTPCPSPHPGRLTVGDARPDDLNDGRFKVNVAFTLPPGAYATLVVKRLFWWTLEPGARKKEEAAERVRAAIPKP
jgi:tRNA pseudouridine13 synthase